MNFVGIDLHKKTITIGVVGQERKVRQRRGFYGNEPERIVAYLQELGVFSGGNRGRPLRAGPVGG